MRKKIFSVILSCLIILMLFLPFVFCFSNVPAQAVSYTADSTWYSASKSVLEINDIPDFIAFMNKMNELGTTDGGATLGANGNLASISWTGKMPFEGQTIILNTDIVLNSGITFSTSGPSNTSAYKFSRTKNVGFGGIFDGQGHTISGLYISASSGGAGSIFGVAGAATKRMNVVVRNLQIKNSLIENSAMGVASIFSSAAFNNHVLIENVYSEAILKSNQTTVSTDSNLNKSIIGVNIGGFCATVGGNLTIVNSVYEGTFVTMDTSATPKKYIGGMVGNITNKKLNDNESYAGGLTVNSSAYYGKFEGSAAYMGKLSGDQTAGTRVTVNNSIFGGDMKPTNTTTPNYIGRFVGLCTSNYTININKSVYTPIYYKGTETSIKANYNKLSDAILGSAIDMAIIVDGNINGAKDSLHTNIDLYWVSNGTMNGYPVPANYVNLFGKESLKHNYVIELPITSNQLFAELGVKIANDGSYTEDSYRYYSDAYDEIASLIYDDNTIIENLNVAELKANAESILVTPVGERRTELKSELGTKIVNFDDYYTADSYTSYSNAYDDIVKCLDEATTLDALNSIDVVTLKLNAEAKLVTTLSIKRGEAIKLLGTKISNDNGVYTAESYENYSIAFDMIVSMIESAETVSALEVIDVPTLKASAEAILVEVSSETEIPETDTPETDTPETEAPETEKLPAKKGCGSCGSSAALSAVAVVGIIGVALVAKRKE